MRKIKAILWDFDGTLLNSTRESMKNMRSIAKLLGLRIPTFKILKEHWGISWLKFIDKIAKDCDWPEGSPELFVDKCRENKQFWEGHKLFPKIKETLKTLIFQGIKVGIISTRIKESAGRDLFSIMDYLEKLDINPSIFFIIQGRKDCEYLKPNPKVFDPALTILRKDNVNLDQIIYVGDTVNYDLEVTFGYTPNIPFVAVVSGAYKQGFLGNVLSIPPKKYLEQLIL